MAADIALPHDLGMAKKSSKKRHRPTFIREWRKHRGLSQERLAERLEISQENVSLIENGKVAYTQPILEAMAEALNCTPADLIMRPPGSGDDIRDIMAALSPDSQKRAIAVIKALKDTEDKAA
jgi:transcriptional regulator with XRE-family HTH domain